MPKPPKSLTLITEKNSPRGLVPSSTYGRYDEPFNAFLDQINPRENTDAHFALAAATDKRFREFGRIMCEPKFARQSLAAIAKQLDISMLEWAEFWRCAQRARATAVALDGAVNLASDLAQDSRTRKINCDRCDGFGWVYVGMEDAPKELLEKAKIEQAGGRQIRACPTCKGTGTVDKPGDESSRKLLLDMAGMGSRGKGAAVQVNVNTYGGSSMESAVDRLNRVSFDVSDDDVIYDAEPTDVEGEDGSAE